MRDGKEDFLPVLSVLILPPGIFPDRQGNNAYRRVSDAAVAAKSQGIPEESDTHFFWILAMVFGISSMLCHKNLYFPKMLDY